MTPIYRMIHLDNLSNLLEWGGDYSANQCAARNLTKRAIHHAHIMERRQSRTVSCGPGGTLADYVPFYFRSRSPMLYAIQGGQVEGCRTQSDIVILQTTAERVVELGLGFVFTDGHAVIAYSEFFAELGDLKRVPWAAVNARYWNDHVDGKFKCQAEFLVRDFLPWKCVKKVGVFDESKRESITAMLKTHDHPIDVTVERGWYF